MGTYAKERSDHHFEGIAAGHTRPEHARATPLVSVIMPCHNDQAYVADAVDSVRQQSFKNWELLIIDDGSEDGTGEVIRSYAARDPRIKVLVNSRSHGASRARNSGISHAQGRYIAFLDSDDLWHRDKLQSQLSLARHSDCPVFFTHYCKFTTNDLLANPTEVWHQRTVKAPVRLTYRDMLRQDYIGFSTCMYDTAILGRRYLPEIIRRHDYAMLLNILRSGHCAHGVPESLVAHRVGERSRVSSNKLTAARYNWFVYRSLERLSLLRSVTAFVNYAVRAGRKYLI